MHTLTDPKEWIDLYGDYLFRYALLRVSHSHIAEDLLQETLLAALQSRKTFAGQSPERFWLLGILKHKLVDHYRKVRREESGEVVTRDDAKISFDHHGHWRKEAGPRKWMMDPSTILEQKKFWEAITQCLGELPPRHANIYALREIEGFKGNEVCEKFDISEANLWVILYRVRLHLRRCLELRWQGRETKE